MYYLPEDMTSEVHMYTRGAYAGAVYLPLLLLWLLSSLLSFVWCKNKLLFLAKRSSSVENGWVLKL